ncbi:MAG: type IV pilus assembly protein PilM [Candidatus Omnitrophica bacterium]|nr:type IV pilus assembly protein PilM [Candidatus Omnitrophota bacterium]
MMKFGNKKTKEEKVGLDIGSYSVKVVSADTGPGENTLTAYNIKNIPVGEKKIKVGDLVREALDEIDIHPKEVNLSISGPDVIVRFIDLPKMSKDQLKSALSFEAEKYIPFNISEVVLDFLILGDAPEEGQMRVLLAAVKREAVSGMVEMIESLGMTINLIDTDPFAIFNAFSGTNPELGDQKKGIAFLDLGHSKTNILISIGNVPCFMRQIQIGGRDIDEAIAKNMSIPVEKAMELRLGGAKEKDSEAVKNTMMLILDELVKEMHLSYGYFENRYNAKVEDVYCSGGMAYQEGVLDYLSEKLGLSAMKWNPVDSINLSENISKEDIDSVALQLAVSIGLVLRN